ncbi:MAG: hypothetical protein INR63_20900 [Actinomycetospora chiangmaiensis]|nr:hypothetical protein [Actinomycetospora chiangmaiensis]
MKRLILAALAGPTAALLVPAAGRGQDALGLIGPDLPGFEASVESEMRAKVAAAFPEAWLVRFRKVRPIAAEAGQGVAYCGQVSAAAPDRTEQNFHLFLYDRTDGVETVRILGAESLNGYRVGRKLIGALRRVGCL